MKIWKKTGKVLLISVVGLVLAFLVFWLAVIPAGNELILRGHAKDLAEYDAGGAYEVVERIQACGKLYGNGNGMEYVVIELVESDGLVATGPLGLGDGIAVIHASNRDDWEGILSEYNRYDAEAMRNKLEEATDLSRYYILYSLHSAEWDSIWTWDIRAH